MGEALEIAKSQFRSELQIRGMKCSNELFSQLIEPVLETACQEGWDYGKYERETHNKSDKEVDTDEGQTGRPVGA